MEVEGTAVNNYSRTMGWPWDCPRYTSLCGHPCFNSASIGRVSGLWLLLVVAEKTIWNLWDFCIGILSRQHTQVPRIAYMLHHHAGGPTSSPTCSQVRSLSPDESIPYPSGLKSVSEENTLNPLGFKYTALCYAHETLTIEKIDTLNEMSMYPPNTGYCLYHHLPFP